VNLQITDYAAYITNTQLGDDRVVITGNRKVNCL